MDLTVSFVTPPLRPLPPRGPRQRPPLGYLLRQAAARHRLALTHALADVDVTPPQFLVLRMLAENPGSSNADLARRAALSTPTVTVILGNLVRRGAVTNRSDAAHGRVRPLDLTPEGSALLAACEERVATTERELEAGLSAAETDAITTWLMRAAHVGHPGAAMAPPRGSVDEGGD